VILDTANGKVVDQPLPVKPKPPVLTKISPEASTRGHSVKIILSGEQLSESAEIVAEEPGLTIRKQPGGSSTQVIVNVTVPPNARVGSYKLRAKSAAGMSAPVDFFVDRFKAMGYESTSQPGKPVPLPATVVGTLAQAGDVARVFLSLTGGQQVGVQLVSTKSKLDAILRAVDSKGRVLAESSNGLLGFTAAHTSQTPQTYVLELHERDFRGSKDMGYRLQMGNIPVITSTFPLGIQRGTEALVQVHGVFLGSMHSVRVSVPKDQPVGSTVPLPMQAIKEPPLGATGILVGDNPEVRPASGRVVSIPVPGVCQWRDRRSRCHADVAFQGAQGSAADPRSQCAPARFAARFVSRSS